MLCLVCAIQKCDFQNALSEELSSGSFLFNNQVTECTKISIQILRFLLSQIKRRFLINTVSFADVNLDF